MAPSEKIEFFGGLMVSPNKFWLLGPMPAAVRTILRKFLKFCPYIRAKFSKIFIRPCHLYSGVLLSHSQHFKCSFFPWFSKSMRDFADVDRIFDEVEAERQNGQSADYGRIICNMFGYIDWD
jgi:hypothetical protein